MLVYIKAVYTSEKSESGPVKKAVRTHNFCKERLEFTRQSKNGTDPTKTGTVPIVFAKNQ